jgi:soluble cytochrome b562
MMENRWSDALKTEFLSPFRGKNLERSWQLPAPLATVAGKNLRRQKKARLLQIACVKRTITMLKTPLPLLATSLSLALFVAASLPARAQDDEPKTPLAIEMGGIAKDFRALRKIVSDPAQKDAALALAKDMEAHATKAKTFEPSKTKEIPPADQAKFVADYKTQMDGLIADFQKLEQDISAGDTAGASATLDKLQQDKRDGHKKFNGH